MLIDHMSTGLSFESFGAKAFCGKQTLYDWVKAHPDFALAKDIAMVLCQEWWEKAGLDGMYRGGRDTPFQSAMWNFNMSARFKWAYKQENSVTVSRLEDLLSVESTNTIEAKPHKIEHTEDIIDIEPIEIKQTEKVKSNEN